MGICHCGKVAIWIFDLQKVGPGHELQHHWIRCWVAFCGLRDGEKMADISITNFLWSTSKTYTHGHTLAIAIAENATCWIMPKINNFISIFPVKKTGRYECYFQPLHVFHIVGEDVFFFNILYSTITSDLQTVYSMHVIHGLLTLKWREITQNILVKIVRLNALSFQTFRFIISCFMVCRNRLMIICTWGNKNVAKMPGT